MNLIGDYERMLCLRLVEGLGSIPGVRIHGITDPDHLDDRVPTVIFETEGHDPAEASVTGLVVGHQKQLVSGVEGDQVASREAPPNQGAPAVAAEDVLDEALT